MNKEAISLKPILGFLENFATKNYQGTILKTLEDVSKAPKVKSLGGLGFAAKPLGKAVRANPSLSALKPGFGQELLRTVNPKSMAGEAAHNITQLHKQGPLDFFKNQISEARIFERDGWKYRRSIPGQIMNVALTGPGMFATDFLASDPNQPLHKRLGSATASGALWGLSPRFGGSYYLGKTLYNVLKPKSITSS